jgi:flagellar biosynthesis GTPase FlhF
MGRALVNRGRSKRVFVNDDERYQNFIPLLVPVIGGAGVGIGNLLGNKKAKSIDANTDRIKAETERLRAETDAQAKDVEKQLQDAEQKTKEAKDLQDKLKAKLEEAKNNKKEIEKVTNKIQQQTSQSNTNKYLLIGAGIIGVIIVVALVVKK